ncbi:MAG: hypothetical protein IKS20_11450 [Victivallales bacterium]|nr:hypothetical protein [Victivallales bacterium]
MESNIFHDKGAFPLFADSASAELIWADAYPRNDPHLVKTWSTEYTVKALIRNDK